MLKHFHHRVAEKTSQRSAPPVLIVALGDSVTQGCTAQDVFEFDAVYHAQIKRMLEQRWPMTTFSVINAGVAGDSAAEALARVQRDVTSHHPDLVIIGFGLNDACGLGRARIAEFSEPLQQIVSNVRSQCRADVILLTPPMMATHDNPAVPPQHRQTLHMMMQVQNEGVLGEFAQAIREIGRASAAPVVDVYAEWEHMHRQGVDTNALLANGLNHPNARMHRLAAEMIFNLIVQHAS